MLLFYLKRFFIVLLLIFLITNLILGIRSFFVLSIQEEQIHDNDLLPPLIQQQNETLDIELEPDHLQQIKQKKELRVGMIKQSSRFYVDYFNLNQFNGFEFAVLKQFADSLKVDLAIYFEDNIEALLNMHHNDEIDFIASEIDGFEFDNNNEYVSSLPYSYFKEQLIYKNNSKKIAHLGDLNGTLLIAKDSLPAYILKEKKKSMPKLHWEETKDFNEEQLLKLVATNQIDYTILDHKTINLMQRIYPEIKIAFDVVSDYPEVWYFKKTDLSLLDSANQFIDTSQKNNKLDEIYNLYFSNMTNEQWIESKNFMAAVQTKLPRLIPFFKKYGALYHIDWKMLAAISYQESHWDPNSQSETGVRGLMMLTEATASTMGITNRTDSEQSIKGGAKFLNLLINKMDDAIDPKERILFALTAYNMGYAHLIDARRLAVKLNKDPNHWHTINEMLPLLTQEEYYKDLKYGFARGYQAFYYVNNIQRYYLYLKNYYDEDDSPNRYLSPYDEKE